MEFGQAEIGALIETRGVGSEILQEEGVLTRRLNFSEVFTIGASVDLFTKEEDITSTNISSVVEVGGLGRVLRRIADTYRIMQVVDQERSSGNPTNIYLPTERGEKVFKAVSAEMEKKGPLKGTVADLLKARADATELLRDRGVRSRNLTIEETLTLYASSQLFFSDQVITRSTLSKVTGIDRSTFSFILERFGGSLMDVTGALPGNGNRGGGQPIKTYGPTQLGEGILGLFSFS